MSDQLGEVILAGTRRRPIAEQPFLVAPATSAEDRAYRQMRDEIFVREQGLFETSDHDAADDDPRTVVLVARSPQGDVLGGVRLHPMLDPDCGWWRGSRLVVSPASRRRAGSRTAPASGVGSALVRAACAMAESHGALRFDATIQSQNEVLFSRLGWISRETCTINGREHVRVEWPIGSLQQLANQTKSMLGELFGGALADSDFGTAFLGDDAAPVPDSEVLAACDAILPSMVERDPRWAGWCSVLVNMNDLAAMGARPLGILDALGARDETQARLVVAGMRDAAEAWGVPILGGHTQLGVPSALSVTALGKASNPVLGGGAEAGQRLRVTADLTGQWRPGYRGRQWDSTSRRSSEELHELHQFVARLQPAAAKDVSMSGLVGTVGMLAEASGCAAVVDVADIPSPSGTKAADWLTCFPGFAMVTADHLSAHRDELPSLPPGVASSECGEVISGSGVKLRWPDGVQTQAIASAVTGLGATKRGADS